jgi:hypothetical protein
MNQFCKFIGKWHLIEFNPTDHVTYKNYVAASRESKERDNN